MSSTSSKPPRDERPTCVRETAVLRVLTGPDAGRLLAPPGLPCTFGRGGTSQILLADPDDPPALSREHFTLSRLGGALAVTDHSTNGTRVAGRRLGPGETARLLPGEELQAGPTLRLRLLEGEGAPPHPGARLRPSRTGRPGAPAARRGAEPDERETLSLRERVTAPGALAAAWERVRLNGGAPGPDGTTVAEFGADASRRLAALREELRDGRYRPLPPRRVALPKRGGGVRTIAILSVPDRVVQHALHAALQPLLEPLFPACSYAYRPGLSPAHALRAVDGLLAGGLTWVAETDIAAFFDSVSHHVLLDRLAEAIPDPWALALVAQCLAAATDCPGTGLPQGGAVSPLLSNFYLVPFDRHLLGQGWNVVRYGDDLVVPCPDRAAAQAVLAGAEAYLRSHLHLALRPEKTTVTPLERGFTFLGFRFDAAGRRPAPEAVLHLEGRLREADPDDAPAIRRGWEAYFGPESPRTASPVPDTHSPILPFPDTLPVHILERFSGREDVHARQSFAGGRMRFTPCAGTLPLEAVRAHLAGTESLALYLHRLEGTVQVLVLDLDARQVVEGPGAEMALRPVAEAALDLRRVLAAAGIDALLEDSGRRGRHLWVFFAGPVPPDRARRLARLAAARAGFPREGVRLEVLPRHREWPGPELGDAVKLPFGVHPATGQRCPALGPDGEPLPCPLQALDTVRPVTPEALDAALRHLAEPPGPPSRPTAAPTPDRRVEQLLAGCSVLRALLERAARTGRLRHTERLIFLYTAGHLGEEGARLIHRACALCANYDERICQGYLDRLEPGRKPISCARIREWLEEEGETGLCTCDRTRRTPLELVQLDPAPPRRTVPAAPSGATAEETAALWSAVAADLFGDPAVEPQPEPDGSAGSEEAAEDSP